MENGAALAVVPTPPASGMDPADEVLSLLNEKGSNESDAAVAVAVATDAEPETPLMTAIKAVFDKYDVDGVGQFKADGLASLLSSISGSNSGLKLSAKVLGDFIAQVDQNGDGMIQLKEFSDFVCAAVSSWNALTVEQKLQYVCSTKIRAQIALLVLDVLDKCDFTNEDNEAVCEKDREIVNHPACLQAIESMFRQYDIDSSGTLDSEEIRDLMVAICNYDEDQGTKLLPVHMPTNSPIHHGYR